MISKICKKSTHFWKHGKHGGKMTIQRIANQPKKKRKTETIDLSKPDWSIR